jgi:hypothetical protein
MTIKGTESINYNPSYSNEITLDKNETIDQYQTNNSGQTVKLTNSSWWFAQQFRPKLNILTKVSLYLGKYGTFLNNEKLNISIRKYLYKELRSLIIDPNDINTNGSWIDCNFSFIPIDVNESYYIVCNLEGASNNNYIEWYFEIENPYKMGKTYFSDDGNYWDQYEYSNRYREIDFCFKTYGMKNYAPNKPNKPQGPTKGQYDKLYIYSSKSVDKENDDVFYQWNWGDGEISNWLGPYHSGEICETEHKWMIKGSYLIKVKSRDKWGFESSWSESLTIRMEKNKVFYDLCDSMFIHLINLFLTRLINI